MMRKAIIALFALAAIGLAQPTAAFARGGGGGGGHGGGGGGHGGGFHGGGFHGGSFHGGFAGRGFHGGAFHGRFHRRAFVGLGFAPYYDGYYPYAYNDYYDDGGCYVVRRRVHTRYGWRVRPVQVCG
jgi:hypothetical protein